MRQEPRSNGGGDLGEEIAKARLADYNELLDVTVRAIEAGGEEAGPLVLQAELDTLAEGRLKNILAVGIVNRALEIVRTRKSLQGVPTPTAPRPSKPPGCGSK